MTKGQCFFLFFSSPRIFTIFPIFGKSTKNFPRACDCFFCIPDFCDFFKNSCLFRYERKQNYIMCLIYYTRMILYVPKKISFSRNLFLNNNFSAVKKNETIFLCLWQYVPVPFTLSCFLGTFYQIWKNRKNPGSRKKQKK